MVIGMLTAIRIVTLQSWKTAGLLHLINFGGDRTAGADWVAAGQIDSKSDADTTTSSVSDGLKLNGDVFEGQTRSIRPLNPEMDVNSNINFLGFLNCQARCETRSRWTKWSRATRILSLTRTRKALFRSGILFLRPSTNKVNKSDDGQLILLSKDRRTISRWNEFNNYSDMNEASDPH
ncbi:hypothetical protein NDK25_07540 [Niallia taxi]|nr:hypothetical protein [Niallia taxi]MDE5052260.1 hypothetical protein [Niallia taxi]